MTDPDLTISLNDTVELDTIIEKNIKALDPINDVSNGFEKDGILTYTGILNPKDPGEYTIKVNSKEIVIKVTDPDNIPDSVLTEDLVAWYRFEDGDARDYTSRLDSSFADENSYDGIVNGATFQRNGGILDYNSGVNSGAYNFISSDKDAIIVNHSGELSSSEYTRMGWINPDEFGSDIRRTFSTFDNSTATPENSGYGTFTRESGVIEHDHYDSNKDKINLQSSSTINTNTWTHVSVTFDGGTHKIYLNASEDAKSSQQSGTNSNTADFEIGNTPHTNSESFDGQIDDVRHYNRALKESEITNIYNATKP